MYQKQSIWEKISIYINLFILDVYLYFRKLFKSNLIQHTYNKNPNLNPQ